MDRLTQERFNELLTQENGLCASVYMPTVRGGPETRQNPIRFKNLLNSVEADWRACDPGDAIPEELFEPARQLVDDTRFWENQEAGMAMFLAEGKFEYFRLDEAFEPLSVVTDRFHITPLIPILNQDQPFYLLALSQNQVRLFEGSGQTIQALSPEGMPASLQEALNFDLPQKQLQSHAGSRGGEMIFHGQGTGSDDEKDAILRYLQAVNKGLEKLLAGQPIPLVVASDEPIFSIFREANSHPWLVDQPIPGNPEELSARELHQRAWELLLPRLRAEAERAMARYMDRLNTEQTSADLRTVLPAAFQGRVDRLFLARGRHQWGRHDPHNDQMVLGEQKAPGDADLLDRCAAYTLRKGGRVHLLEPDRIPGGGELAALFRY